MRVALCLVQKWAILPITVWIVFIRKELRMSTLREQF